MPGSVVMEPTLGLAFVAGVASFAVRVAGASGVLRATGVGFAPGGGGDRRLRPVQHVGEGAYEETGAKIRELLAEKDRTSS